MKNLGRATAAFAIALTASILFTLEGQATTWSESGSTTSPSATIELIPPTSESLYPAPSQPTLPASVTGSVPNASAPVTSVVPGPSPAELASTGVSVILWVIIGFGLVTLGGAALLSRRAR